MIPNDPRYSSIGVFDSGFGGLTVMRALRELMPYENIVYFGDTARLPYGNKSAETILRYSLENALFLLKQNIKILVIACNTSCSVGLEEVRKACSVPVIGVTEQGIEEVASLGPQQKVAILGTQATIKSGIYQQQILARCPSMELYPISCPLFVPLVEEGYIEHPSSALITQEYLRPLKHKGLDAVLLGCTHYPLLETLIQRELGPEVNLLDPAIACAKKTQKVLSEENLLNPSILSPHFQFFVSDDPEKFQLLGKTFLNYPIDQVLTTSEKF